MTNQKKGERFSFSKVETYGKCGYCYWLKYVQGNFVDESSIATEFGTLCHHIYERIGAILIAGGKPDYKQLQNEFHTINVPKKGPRDVEGGIYGIDILSKKYEKDFYDADNKDGLSYADKSAIFLGNEEQGTGMFSLEHYLKAHPSIQLKAVEQYFELEYYGVTFVGYIDRVLYDKSTDEYIIEDIKTKGHLFSDRELPDATQQFIVYSMALKNIYNLDKDVTRFAYDLPFVGMAGVRQTVGNTRGWQANGIKKLQKRLDGIKEKVFEPNPTPLCHWCAYCGTNPNQPKEAKYLCPYYSLWMSSEDSKKQGNVLNQWEGWEHHEAVMDHYLHDQCGLPRINVTFDFDY
jgi:putative RecB family exonuclease